MIDAILRASLRHRMFVLLCAAALLVFGGFRAASMPIDIFPDLTAPTVTVLVEAHGMAPEEVEVLVTTPVETALAGATGVRRVRSATSVGVATVWVEFDWDTPILVARQVVAEKLQLVQPSLPPGLDPPVLAPIFSIMGEIMFIGLSSKARTARDLRTLADWEVRRRLLAVPGVAQVVPIGGEVQQFQVVLRPQALAAQGVTAADVIAAVQASNLNVSAGFYRQAGQQSLIYGLGRAGSADDIARAVVQLRPGAPLRVLDVADVVVGSALQLGDGAVNGRPGVILGIQKQPDAHTIGLTAALDAALDELDRDLPPDVVIERRLHRQADFIQAGVDNVRGALLDGALLVVVILGVFSLSGRATLITALAIPLSLVVTALLLDVVGGSLNTMTLGGMAIAVGALVDDAIIDVENVMRRLRERLLRGERTSALQVVLAASQEIRGSIVFATLLTMLVFVPLFFLHGVEGKLLFPLGLAYVVSLATSLVVALTVTPALCSLLLPTSRAVRSGVEPAPVRWMRRAYEPILRRAMAIWPALVALSAIAVVAAGVALTRTGRSFLPEFNEGALTISVVTLPGTTLAESNRLGAEVERLLLRHPEVVTTARRTGRAEFDEHAQGLHASEIDARLAMGTRPKAALLTALRADFASVQGANVVVGQPISHRIDHMISGTRASVAVKVFGPDLEVLRRLAERIEAELQGIAGVVDLAVEEQANLPLLGVRYDRDALSRYGLTVREVGEAMDVAFSGQRATTLRVGARAFDVVVRYPDDARTDLDALRRTMLPTPGGGWVPLEALAHIERERGPNQISREDGQRKVVVMCNVGGGRDLGSVVGDIQRRVEANVARPEGYQIRYGGQLEAAEEATRTLSWLGALVGLGVLMLLYLAMRSLRDSLLVLLNLPLALIGGVVGVFVAGGVLSIASVIGFVALFGIAARNGIMLVTHARHLVQHEGVRDPVEAVIRAASERLAPIFMTALAAGLGLLPLALAADQPGSEIQAPMATVILFGLASSTLLNMLVVPALMLRFGSVRNAAQYKVADLTEAD